MKASRLVVQEDGSILLTRLDGTQAEISPMGEKGDFHDALVQLIHDYTILRRERSEAHSLLNELLHREPARLKIHKYFKRREERKKKAQPKLCQAEIGCEQAICQQREDAAIHTDSVHPLHHDFAAATNPNHNPTHEENNTMTTPNVPTTTEYLARLNLKNTLCTLVGPDIKHMKEQISALTPDHKVNFQHGPNNTIYLYHPEFGKGNAPFGWITEYSVPANLSVEATIEARKVAALEMETTARTS